MFGRRSGRTSLFGIPANSSRLDHSIKVNLAVLVSDCRLVDLCITFLIVVVLIRAARAVVPSCLSLSFVLCQLTDFLTAHHDSVHSST